MPSGLELILQRDAARAIAGEALRLEVRDRLRRALAELIPGARVLVVGSLTTHGHFHARSDVDLAVDQIPTGWSPYALATEIEVRVGRPVDLIELSACRFAAKLRREGEWWTP